MALVIERESAPVFVAVEVTLDDVVTTSGVEFAITKVTQPKTRPVEADWTPAYILDSKTGILVYGNTLTPGAQYTIWYRVTSPPELVVKEAGRFVVG